MKESSKGSNVTWGKVVLWTLVIAVLIILLPLIVLWGVWSYSPDTVDYSGTITNSAGESFNAEIKTTGDLHGKSFITLTDANGRSVDYRVRFSEPEDALPKDIRTVDIDEDTYIIWVCEDDDNEMICYRRQTDEPRDTECKFYLDSDNAYVSEDHITAIGVIEKSKALDSLPDDEARSAKWEKYFSKLINEYNNSSKTVSKEDSV